MENESSNLRESLWRRQPADAERAGLRARPELAAEARLTAALAKIPDATVASNFTAHVMDAIEREERMAARSSGWRWSWRSLFPRLAVAAAVLVFTGVNVQRYEASSQRQEMARSVAMVASAKSVPSVEVLENLEVIQRMTQSAHADGELLADLQ
jgi:negative regulator of sigma E activity